MGSGAILFTTLVLSLIIGVIGWIILKQGHKNQKAAYSKLWEDFQKLREDDSVVKTAELIELGNKLIYNKYIPTKHLIIIQEFAKDLEFRYPEFEELRVNAYDRWIHRTQEQGVRI